MRRLALCFVLAVPWVASVRPVAAHPEVEAVLAEMVRLLPGDFDSRRQVELERALGAPPDGVHEHWYRTMRLIDAPQIGEIVFYGELRVGGPGGPLVPGQQILYVPEIDEARQSVNLVGQGLEDPERFERLHENPGLQREVRMRRHPDGPCDFHWRFAGPQLRGKLGDDGTCTVRSRASDRNITWDAEWILNDEALWIFDNGTVEGVGLILGREDRTHTRLYRVTPFSCALDLHGGEGGTRWQRDPLLLGDQGGSVDLSELGGPALTLELRNPSVPAADGRSLRTRRTLALVDTAASATLARAHADGDATHIGFHAEAGSVLCHAAPDVPLDALRHATSSEETPR